MCGRYNLRLTSAELQTFFDLFRVPEVTPRYNIAPLQSVIAIRAEPAGWAADFLRWGLVPRWADDPAIGSRMINARSESAAEKSAFAAAFQQRRCLIPASGFYEWQPLGKHASQPWHITRVDGRPLIFAGLWERWERADEVRETCTILTTSANAFMGLIHERMPVILSLEDARAWLGNSGADPATMASATSDSRPGVTLSPAKTAALQALLRPCPEDWLQRTPVSPHVNNVRHDDPDCLASTPVQRNLF